MVFLYPLIKEANDICFEKNILLSFSPYVDDGCDDEISIWVDNDKG